MLALSTARDLLAIDLDADSIAASYERFKLPPAQILLHAMFLRLTRQYPLAIDGMALAYSRAISLVAFQPSDLPARAMAAVDDLRSGKLLSNEIMQSLLESSAGNPDGVLAVHAMLAGFAELFAEFGVGEKSGGDV